LPLAISGTELEPTESIAHLIDCARALAIPFIELWYPRNTETDGLERTFSSIREAGLRVACISTGSELYRRGGSPEDVNLLNQAIDLARSVDAPFVNTYFGYYDRRDDTAAIKTYRRLLEPCLARAEESNVTIVLENEFNAFGVDPAFSDITRRPETLRQLLEEVDSTHFRLNFDPCNFYCAGVEPFPYAYELLKSFIAYTHVKDGCRLNAALADAVDFSGWRCFKDYDDEFVMRPMGEGAIPWANILRRFQVDGYSGFLTLEPHAEIPRRREAWEQAAAYVRGALPQKSDVGLGHSQYRER
jgi:sugar phosphate isomerase/epimerase